jgi:hypothetical protein
VDYPEHKVQTFIETETDTEHIVQELQQVKHTGGQRVQMFMLKNLQG